MRREDRYDSLFKFYALSNVTGGTVDWTAIKAQAMAESSMDPLARSPVGAQGLMQFMPATWQEWNNRLSPEILLDPFNAEHSIWLGTSYMAYLLGRFGRLDMARAAYNWGLGNVTKHIEANGGELVSSKLPAETSDYLDRIDKFHDAQRRLAMDSI